MSSNGTTSAKESPAKGKASALPRANGGRTNDVRDAHARHRERASSEGPLEYPIIDATPAEEQASVARSTHASVSHEEVSFEDVSRAKYRIMDGVQVTACELSHNLSAMTEMELYFKREYQLRTGSFKERGARNALKLLSAAQREKGVIAASAGNHALGLAYHGQDLGIPVTLVMPVFAPLTKVENCRSFGANVIISGAHIGESMVVAKEIAEKQGLQYINGYNDAAIIAGQGTAGLEILEQVPDVDAIIVPVGGGGLIAGVSLAVKTIQKNVQIIGVESVACPSFSEAMKAGHPVPVEVTSTLADGLAVPTVGATAFHVARSRVNKMIQVREKDVAIAVLRLLEMEKAIVEGSGACGLAALLANYLPELKGKKVVCLLCGGNIDLPVIGRVIERGLAADGRLVRFVVSVSDRPGGIAQLTTLIARVGASVKDIHHERAWQESDVMSVQIKCVVETRSRAHAEELRQALVEAGYPLKWGLDPNPPVIL
ncbi:hypothetical protein PTSG_12710 [Salpingoeca rosetta]|uniref:ACT domain-containing protein n=1 Tax=Salpingoeca rosetta (strain ATCC 50818 / BSB-021) TaxID=946362 RepID=F2UJF1_SALR5|nr:uncharacterized protein PTSG_12710 [Salpingoeca rosetta]EGD77250.1 hypothetical protein PTSG_12710 [Salpingoeca rosetta]|eukprot:XP_004990594.1 hypothetical protein PTSG_12710 [Salpingoeca rosetta]